MNQPLIFRFVWPSSEWTRTPNTSYQPSSRLRYTEWCEPGGCSKGQEVGSIWRACWLVGWLVGRSVGWLVGLIYQVGGGKSERLFDFQSLTWVEMIPFDELKKTAAASLGDYALPWLDIYIYTYLVHPIFLGDIVQHLWWCWLLAIVVGIMTTFFEGIQSQKKEDSVGWDV